jgi:hypothetical protein
MDLTRIEIDRKVREVYWAGDQAVDLAASDLALWETSGDGLVPHEKQKPTLIKWRPLEAAEKAEVRAYVGSVRGYLILCCAYGIVSVGDLVLRRKREGILNPITAASLTNIEAMGDDENYPARVPAVDAQFNQVMDDEGKQLLVPISPLEWLGGLISGASFRKRG